MKRKSNIFLLFLTVFFLIFSSNVTQAATISLSRPQPAASGKFVASGKYWTYQYDDKTIAKNEFLKIGKRTYYFNKYGYRWYGWHTVNGKKYYFGTRSQGYLFRNSLIHYKGDYYYAGKDGAAITGWCTDASGRKFYFGSDYKAVTGQQKIKKVNYYFDNSGVLHHSGLNYNLSSDCALLINADTGKVIYSKNADVPHANASTTKIMTCILALENCKLNEKVKFSPYASSIEAS